VARALAATASKPTVHLETDQLFRSIRTGFVLPYLPEAAAQNEVVLTATVRTVDTFTAADYDVIVEGIIGPWFLPHFEALKNHQIDYIVLLPTLEHTLARADARSAAHLHDPAPITGLHGAFPRDSHAIDTTGQELPLTVSHVRNELATGHYRLSTPLQPPVRPTP